MDAGKNKRKALQEQYGRREITGGIYRIVNRETGRAWQFVTPELRAAKNKFDFMVQMNTCSMNALQDDWAQYGPGAFAFEIVESITRGENESDAEFTSELEALRNLHLEASEKN